MNPNLAKVLNGNHIGEDHGYVVHPAIADPTRWMSWQEVADRLQVRIKETKELLDAVDSFDFDRIHPDFAYARAANLGTIALDLVALRHMHAVATRFAIAFEQNKEK
jgi:hypothetical protein